MRALIVCAVVLAVSPVAAENWYAQQESQRIAWAIDRQTDLMETNAFEQEMRRQVRDNKRAIRAATKSVSRSPARVRRPVVAPRYNYPRSRYSYRQGLYGGRPLSSHRNFYGGYSVYIGF